MGGKYSATQNNAGQGDPFGAALHFLGHAGMGGSKVAELPGVARAFLIFISLLIQLNLSYKIGIAEILFNVSSSINS